MVVVEKGRGGGGNTVFLLDIDEALLVFAGHDYCWVRCVYSTVNRVGGFRLEGFVVKSALFLENRQVEV